MPIQNNGSNITYGSANYFKLLKQKISSEANRLYQENNKNKEEELEIFFNIIKDKGLIIGELDNNSKNSKSDDDAMHCLALRDFLSKFETTTENTLFNISHEIGQSSESNIDDIFELHVKQALNSIFSNGQNEIAEVVGKDSLGQFDLFNINNIEEKRKMKSTFKRGKNKGQTKNWLKLGIDIESEDSNGNLITRRKILKAIAKQFKEKKKINAGYVQTNKQLKTDVKTNEIQIQYNTKIAEIPAPYKNTNKIINLNTIGQYLSNKNLSLKNYTTNSIELGDTVLIKVIDSISRFFEFYINSEAIQEEFVGSIKSIRKKSLINYLHFLRFAYELTGMGNDLQPITYLIVRTGKKIYVRNVWGLIKNYNSQKGQLKDLNSPIQLTISDIYSNIGGKSNIDVTHLIS